MPVLDALPSFEDSDILKTNIYAGYLSRQIALYYCLLCISYICCDLQGEKKKTIHTKLDLGKRPHLHLKRKKSWKCVFLIFCGTFKVKRVPSPWANGPELDPEWRIYPTQPFPKFVRFLNWTGKSTKEEMLLLFNKHWGLQRQWYYKYNGVRNNDYDDFQ